MATKSLRYLGPHQYIERDTGKVRTEKLHGDEFVLFLYSTIRERAPLLFKTLTSRRVSRILGYLAFDNALGARMFGSRHLMKTLGIDLRECLEPLSRFITLRSIFERKIRYWEYRPMPLEANAVVCPADSRVVLGSFADRSALFIKGKFFDLDELLGTDEMPWRSRFESADFAVFRITPDQYHYNHTPVAGRVVAFYQLPGNVHSCNPAAVVTLATPYSKNQRAVTVIDTDVAGGTQVGLVAMIEVVALLIGDIVQCYSSEKYDYALTMEPGMFLKIGQPKSLYRPGSSTTILLFEKERIEFAEDLIDNLQHEQVSSRFSLGFGHPLVETEVKVRSALGRGRVDPVAGTRFEWLI